MVGGQVDVDLGGTAVAVAAYQKNSCVIMVKKGSTVEGRGGGSGARHQRGARRIEPSRGQGSERLTDMIWVMGGE